MDVDGKYLISAPCLHPAPGGDKQESRTESELSTMKAFRRMTRKPPLTSPASAWRKVLSVVTAALRITKSIENSLRR